jgi:histidinol phosphatase-like PHP family hydrolase
MALTGDGHVHSEWSWDTGGPESEAAGTMEAMCRRALKIGLPALAFTEHLDLTGWVIEQEDLLDHLLRDIAGSGRALELNIGGPLRPWIPQWWSEEGGRAITFASDAHTTDALAGNFYEAMALAEHFGFRQGRHPEDFWTR